MAGFTQQMRRANLRSGARALLASTVPNDANITTALSVQPSTSIREIVRVHFVRREPLAIER
jgi:GntR family transcriptional regulator